MSSIVTDAGRIFFDVAAHRVYARQKWSDPWQLVIGLYCERLQFVAGPASGSAALVREHGILMQPDEEQFDLYLPFDLFGWWVKIELDQPADFVTGAPRAPVLWHGRIWERPQHRLGQLTDTLDNLSVVSGLAGEEYFTAFGLEYELTRAYLTESICQTTDGEQTIRRGIAFNRARGDQSQSSLAAGGNASTSDGEKGTRIFAQDLADAEEWHASGMLQYLLAYHTAKDSTGEPELVWEYSPQGDDFLTWHKPAVEAHGKSLKQLVDELIDRRRLAGYYVEVAADEKVLLRPFSFAVEPITLASGDVLPPNASQREFDFDQSFDVDEAAVVKSIEHQVQRVRVVGARRAGIGTLSAYDGTLIKHWTDQQKTDYDAGFSLDPSYSGLDRAGKEQANDRARLADAVKRVYRYFGLDKDWDGKVGDAAGGAKHPLFPRLDDDGQLTAESSPFWFPGLRFEAYLPLQTDHDYAQSSLTPDNIPNTVPTGAQAEFRVPFGAIKLSTTPADPDYNKWMPLGEVGLGKNEQAGNAGRGWSAHLQMQPLAAGVVLTVSTPAAAHLIAKNLFTPRPDSECAEIAADLDWQDDLLVTVCALADEHVEAVQPPPAELAAADAIREQVIDVGDDYRLDYVAPGTVVDVKNGALQRTSSGGFIRDDRPRLKDIARLAWEWYKRPRQALQIGYQQTLKVCHVGDLITKIGPPGAQQEVNSVVTSLSIALSGEKPRIDISTDFGELDAAAFERPTHLAPQQPRA